ncbi:Tetraspanin family-domain-containing protein [Cokeromyces recurvatus]|uniref:Tetraspanin family-domain-containing protein n=1 Tax=Cokeromyces recurvatus TaxID=90255 RepID=UPI00221F1220|nr:Tetraspanin family-domain-containing protein [Cokeromyces recurvatus]KAI7898825.1 Tetraspanin family-domain-containing protein [Cokeromyces recurvatus]
MMATQSKIQDSILYPTNILKMITILGLILVFTSLIGILGGYYREKKAIHILYTTCVIFAFIYQISIAAIVYDQTAHISNWLSDTWNESTKDYKLYAQNKFNCCGFSYVLDHSVATPTCLPHQLVNTNQPCYRPLNHFIQTRLTHIYIALFTSLAIELLALCNVINLLCTERKRREISPEDYIKQSTGRQF